MEKLVAAQGKFQKRVFGYTVLCSISVISVLVGLRYWWEGRKREYDLIVVGLKKASFEERARVFEICGDNLKVFKELERLYKKVEGKYEEVSVAMERNKVVERPQGDYTRVEIAWPSNLERDHVQGRFRELRKLYGEIERKQDGLEKVLKKEKVFS